MSCGTPNAIEIQRTIVHGVSPERKKERERGGKKRDVGGEGEGLEGNKNNEKEKEL